MKLLIDRGADVNISPKMDFDFVIWTPLMMAVSIGHYQICHLLLEHGAMLDMPQEVSVCTNSYLYVKCYFVYRKMVVNMYLLLWHVNMDHWR